MNLKHLPLAKVAEHIPSLVLEAILLAAVHLAWHHIPFRFAVAVLVYVGLAAGVILLTLALPRFAPGSTTRRAILVGQCLFLVAIPTCSTALRQSQDIPLAEVQTIVELTAQTSLTIDQRQELADWCGRLLDANSSLWVVAPDPTNRSVLTHVPGY